MKSKQFIFLALSCMILVLAIFFMSLSQDASGSASSEVSLAVTAKVVMLDLPTAVLDISMPAEMNTASFVYFPIDVEMGDFNGVNDLGNSNYVARFFNAGHAQIGEDVALELSVSGKGDEKVEVDQLDNESNIMKLSGTAELPGVAEGYYYVFIFQIEGDNEKILPFASGWEETKNSCCSGTNLSYLYISTDRDSLIPVSEDFLLPGCTEDWCCGCFCTGGNIKNRILLKTPPPNKKNVNNFWRIVTQKQEQQEQTPPENESLVEVVYGEMEVKAMLSETKNLKLTVLNSGCCILIPYGAADPGTLVCLRVLEPENLPKSPDGQVFGSVCFEIKCFEKELSKNIRISIPYTEEDLEIVGGDTSKLKLAYWDEVKEKWIIMPTLVDEEEMRLNTISRHLGLWTVLSPQPAEPISSISPQADRPEINPIKYINSKLITPIVDACNSVINWLKGLLHHQNSK